MEEIINDLFQSVERLNSELKERIEFEHKLLDIINSKNLEINDLKKQLNQQQEENKPLEEYLKDIEKSNAKKELLTKGIID